VELLRLIRALGDPAAYEPRAEGVVVRQTHISVVSLAGPFAYKVKKPVRLGFVDYGTLERRRHFCHEEARLNRRLAPEVYLGVVPIVREGEGGRLRVEGTGEVVEWAVKMRRLPDEARLKETLARGDVDRGVIEELGRRIAAFHATARRDERIAEHTRFEKVARLFWRNLDEARGQIGRTIGMAEFDRLVSLSAEWLARLGPLIESRADRGSPCDGHGDLRLDHVYLFPDRPCPGDMILVDCIEFDEALRAADPLADMAFLVMELIAHGRRDLADFFTDAYLSAAGDFEGRPLLPLYVAYRASVRGKVEGLKAADPTGDAASREAARLKSQARWLLAREELEGPGGGQCPR
jgi:aminoglycoside phosphotransferase family enzyme